MTSMTGQGPGSLWSQTTGSHLGPPAGMSPHPPWHQGDRVLPSSPLGTGLCALFLLSVSAVHP